MKIYDGNGYILGRLASYIAKDLLKGENVALLNCEKLFITGNKKVIVDKYIARRHVLLHQDPEHGPKWPRKPDLLVKRIIRGMLPYKSPRGRLAQRKLKVYMGVPEQLREIENKAENVMNAKTKEGQKGIDIEKLCQNLGYQIKR